jgi:hypothetical protein
MTIEQACCVCCGIILQSLTFALGIFVGATMRRKEPDHGQERPGATRSIGSR